MLGAKVKLAREAAGEYEMVKLGELGLNPEMFTGMKKLAPGSRRSLCDVRYPSMLGGGGSSCAVFTTTGGLRYPNSPRIYRHFG